MGPSGSGGDPPARGSRQKSGLNQEGFDDILQCAALLTDGSCKTVDADRTAIEPFHHRKQQLAIQYIQPELIDLQHIERLFSDPARDLAV